MTFIVEPVMGGINTALNNGLSSMGGSSKLILGLVLGGMMAIDMGGPFNKASYVFGTAAIASGNYDVMAAVMILSLIHILAGGVVCAADYRKRNWCFVCCFYSCANFTVFGIFGRAGVYTCLLYTSRCV